MTTIAAAAADATIRSPIATGPALFAIAVSGLMSAFGVAIRATDCTDFRGWAYARSLDRGFAAELTGH